MRYFLTFLFLMISLPSFAIEIVAFINQAAITDYDIKARIALIKVISPQKMRRRSTQEKKNFALLSLINDEAKMSLVKKNKTGASKKDVDNTLKGLLKGRKSLPHFSYPLEYYKEYLYTQMSWMKVIQMRIAPNTNLAEGEVENYYESLKKTPLIPSTLRLSQIIISDSERVKNVYQEMKNVRGCKSFNAKASDYGEAGSGDMGSLSSQSLAMPLQQIFAQAPIGKTLSPMPIGKGAIIFMVCSRHQKNLLKDEKIKERIEIGLLNQKIEVLAEQYLQDNRDQMYIEIQNKKYEDVNDELF
ncbi:MAG: hypothetical protein ACTSXV_00250 [Alphaproteobacteria bacterium]